MLEELKVTIERPLTAQSVKELLDGSEDYIQNQLKAPLKAVAEKKGRSILLIDGPSCGGKSGVALLIKRELCEMGILSRVISLTSFLKNENDFREECRRRGRKPNFTSIDALDCDYFEECISWILQGETALLPVYDRKSGGRMELIPFTLREGQVLILEGTGVTDERLSPLFSTGGNILTMRVDLLRPYVSNVGRFSASDLRFARRFVRDGGRYGRSAERIYCDLELERAEEREAAVKRKMLFNFEIDTTVAYEPLILKNELHKILGSVKSDSRYYVSSSKFLSRLDTVPELDRSVLPEGSFFRTFL